MTSPMVFRDRSSVRAGGLALMVAGLLTAAGLVFHPLPEHGFDESFQVLSANRFWGLLHVAITAGFALAILGSLLLLVGGGAVTRTAWLAFAWGSIAVGLIFFSGTALINAFVMDKLARAVAAGGDPALFDAFNDLLVGFGWIGDPLFLAGATVLAVHELWRRTYSLPRWIAAVGAVSAATAWLRGAAGLGADFLNWVIIANVPLFLFLAYTGLTLARRAVPESAD